MSESNSAAMVTALDRHAEAALAAVEKLAAKGATDEVPDETAQRLLLAGVRLFAHKIDNENRSIRPVPESANISATEVVVVVTELMRSVDLNMFDLAMWSGRARPDD